MINKKLMRHRWLENPKEIILSQVSRLDNRNPESHSAFDVRPTKKMTLPPIHNQSQCRRFKTQPDDETVLHRSSPLTQLRSAFKMNQSTILSNVSQRLPNLQQMGLVQGGVIKNIRYTGHIRIPTVHNDYHSSKTNGGYSRNKFGGIYPK